MKKAPQFHLFILLLGIALTSCNTSVGRFHKAYIPAPPSNFIYEKEQGVQLQTLVSPADVSLQIGKPVGNQLALTSNLLWGYTGQYNGELGVSYFRHLHPRHYLDIQVGIGGGMVDSDIYRVGQPFLEIFGISENLYSHEYRNPLL